jgi:putative membrane-bound dehydrogenase-like protein
MNGAAGVGRRLFAAALAAACVAGAAFCQGFAPRAAAERMTVAEGLRVRLFASEPEVRQPILVKCDDRGRLWTIQYLQYPNPAGLKRVQVDRWSRTVYDRVPEPPPHGPKGADRITILEDSDGDGRADRFKDFVSDLNLATGLEFGHGGVFVLNVPYLLFYPDRDRDDVPDGDPEVLLSGFGMEDAQSLANHLTWGPDGWLYGVNGSTTTCKIRGVEFQQGCWRYHPSTRHFELFCEGGSNTFGLTFDEYGELFYSTNGGPFVHAVPGGYYYKSFGKHGPLHNPYAYHYFGPLSVDQVPGGPPTGGVVYLGELLPPSFRGRFIAGNFLGHTVSRWKVEGLGVTVRAKYEGPLLDANDTWFGPTDVCVGPDGALYVSDFYDERTAHPDPDAHWDRSNGRIYRVDVPDARPIGDFDLSRTASEALVDLLPGANRWMADRARVELATRRDGSVAGRLRAMLADPSDARRTLAGLWGLNAIGGLDPETAAGLLASPQAPVRVWAARLLGEMESDPRAWDAYAAWLAHPPRPLDAKDRLQAAANARRMRGTAALAVVDAILRDAPDAEEERIDWSTWWAIERLAIAERSRLLEMFSPENLHQTAYRRQSARLVRRYAAEGSAEGYECCLRLLEATPAAHRRESLESLLSGLSERCRELPGVGQGGLFEEHAASPLSAPAASERDHDPVGGPLLAYVKQLWLGDPEDLLLVQLALQCNIEGAYERLLRSLDASVPRDRVLAVLKILREFARPDAEPVVLPWLGSAVDDAVRLAAVDVTARFSSETSTRALLAAYPTGGAELKQRIRSALFGRPPSAAALLAAIESGAVPRDDVALDELRALALFESPEIDAAVRRIWGNVGPGSSEEKLATMRRFQNDLRAGGGDKGAGKGVFARHCGTCHVLFGEGIPVGPDLTSANRNDRAALLANIVDPSAVVRREYLQYIVETTSGRVLTGLLAEQDPASITVLDAKNVRTKVDRSEIESVRESNASLMPERILDPLTPQELRDLFAYLQAGP